MILSASGGRRDAYAQAAWPYLRKGWRWLTTLAHQGLDGPSLPYRWPLRGFYGPIFASPLFLSLGGNYRAFPAHLGDAALAPNARISRWVRDGASR